MELDPYSVLELPWGASAEAIRRAFHRLAFLYHPDRNPEDRAAEARFKLVSAAYQRLKEADWHLPRPAAPASGPTPPGPPEPEVRAQYWRDGAPIHYPTDEEIAELLRNLGNPTLLHRMSGPAEWALKAMAHVAVYGMVVFLVVAVVAIVIKSCMK